MAMVIDVKNKMLDKLAGMDMDKLNIEEMGQYAVVLRTLADISEKSYAEAMSDLFARSLNGNKANESSHIPAFGIGGE